jgi:hypothetical protein
MDSNFQRGTPKDRYMDGRRNLILDFIAPPGRRLETLDDYQLWYETYRRLCEINSAICAPWESYRFAIEAAHYYWFIDDRPKENYRVSLDLSDNRISYRFAKPMPELWFLVGLLGDYHRAFILTILWDELEDLAIRIPGRPEDPSGLHHEGDWSMPFNPTHTWLKRRVGSTRLVSDWLNSRKIKSAIAHPQLGETHGE